jgi:signal recognition particle subunit SRP54
MMGQLGQMMGFGGGMAAPTPEQIAQMQKAMGGAPGAAPPAGGIPTAPPPGAFNLPPQFPGLGGVGGPKLPGLGGGFNPFGGKKK